MNKHIDKFYLHAKDEIDEFLSRVDYSQLSKAKQILSELNSLPLEMHEQIKGTVIDRLKDFYHITMESLSKYSLSDIRLIDEFAVKGKTEILEKYGIKQKDGAKGQPKPYVPKQNYR